MPRAVSRLLQLHLHLPKVDLGVLSRTAQRRRGGELLVNRSGGGRAEEGGRGDGKGGEGPTALALDRADEGGRGGSGRSREGGREERWEEGVLRRC